MSGATGAVETVDGWSVLRLPHLWLAWGRFPVDIQCKDAYSTGLYCQLNKTIKALPTGFTGSDVYAHAEGYHWAHIFHTAKVGADLRVDTIGNTKEDAATSITFRCVVLRVVP